MTVEALARRPLAGVATLRSSGRLLERLALLGIALISVFLSVYQLDQAGYGNSYYAATVRSMMQSWHNFFFASYDPGGFVTVDKPPLGLMIQAVSAKIFGFHGLSLLLPQALANVAAVLLLYVLVRRYFGVAAGLLAALALAVTPISVAIARSNNLDSTLVLLLLAATWALLRAAERGSLRWLLVSMAIIGLGFNVKMMQAYLVLPAFYAVYALGANASIRRRALHLVAGTAVLAAVSLSWAVAVDLTPASDRPYIGSSKTNSVLELAVEYNGIDRLLGAFGRGRGNNQPRQADRADDSATADRGTTQQSDAGGTAAVTPQAGDDSTAVRPDDDAQGTTRFAGPPGGGGPGGLGENGEKGVLRLFNQQLGGQIAWLLPMALVGLVVAAWQQRPRSLRATLDGRQRSVILWGGWLLTTAVFFSIAGFYHRYYLATMAPAVAACAAISAVALWRWFRGGGLLAFALPLAIVVTAAVQVHMLNWYATWSDRLVPLIVAGAGVTALALVVARFSGRARRFVSGWAIAGVGAVTLLAAPAVWSGVTTLDGTGNATLPVAGPQASGFPGGGPGGFPGGGRGGPGSESNSALVEYLQANRGDTKFMVATQSSMNASEIIIETGEPVMALGGFSGGDPIVTAEDIAQMVKDGVVRFFLTGGGPGGFVGGAPPEGATRDGAPDAVQGDMVPPGGQPTQRGAFPGDSTAGAYPPAQGDDDLGPPVQIGGGPMGGNSSVMSWVTANCTQVPQSAIQAAAESGTSTQNGGFGAQLYDCGALRG